MGTREIQPQDIKQLPYSIQRTQLPYGFDNNFRCLVPTGLNRLWTAAWAVTNI
jgi:hypothetical protein